MLFVLFSAQCQLTDAYLPTKQRSSDRILQCCASNWLHKSCVVFAPASLFQIIESCRVVSHVFRFAMKNKMSHCLFLIGRCYYTLEVIAPLHMFLFCIEYIW